MRDTIRKSANRYGKPRKSPRECFLEDENIRLNNQLNSMREQVLINEQRVDGLKRDRTGLPMGNNTPTPAEALRGLLAVLPLHLSLSSLHDPATVEAVKQARAALRKPPVFWFDAGYLNNGHCSFMRSRDGASCCGSHEHTGEHHYP